MLINEIFYSLQGEGRYTGTPAVFVRFSGCNMQCAFCDTQHERHSVMTEEDIVSEVCTYPAHHVVLTGGEPLLQLTSTLVDLLHRHGMTVQIETNGTLPLPEGGMVDWVTCSPKCTRVKLQHIDELKVVFLHEHDDPSVYAHLPASVFSLQPCDTGDAEKNNVILRAAIAYCLQHPQWHLSLQTHKLINIQ